MRLPLLFVVLALASGCGGSASSTAPTAASAPAASAPRPAIGATVDASYLRVALARGADGSVKVLDHERYLASAGAPPPDDPGATHAVIVRDAQGNALDTATVRFADTIAFEDPEAGTRESVKIDSSLAAAVVRLDEGADHVVVVDAAMNELARIGRDALPQAELRVRQPSLDWSPPTGVAATPNLLGQLLRPPVSLSTAPPRSCPHVRFVEGKSSIAFVKNILGTALVQSIKKGKVNASLGVQQPTALQRELVQDALRYLSPMQCKALRMVAFVHDVSPHLGWQTGGSGGLIFLNTHFFSDDLLRHGNGKVNGERWSAFFKTNLAHEATHAVEEMLNTALAPREVTVQWPKADLSYAEKILAKHHPFPGGSFSSEWERIHGSFMRLGLAAPPNPTHAKLPTTPKARELIVKQGYMSRYGASNSWDDLAEMAAWVQTAPLHTRYPVALQRDWACHQLRTMNDKWVPSHYAAVFAKLGFLKSLQIIEEARYDECVGKAKLPEYGPGVHTVGVDGTKRSYVRDLRQEVHYRHLKRDIPYARYQLRADGDFAYGKKTVKGEFRMEVQTGTAADHKPPLPRGIYEVRGGWIGQRNRIMVNAGGHLGRVQVDEGWIIVTEATLDRVRGFIEMRKASRPTALGIPQTGLPDRVFFDMPRER